MEKQAPHSLYSGRNSGLKNQAIRTQNSEFRTHPLFAICASLFRHLFASGGFGGGVGTRERERKRERYRERGVSGRRGGVIHKKEFIFSVDRGSGIQSADQTGDLVGRPFENISVRSWSLEYRITCSLFFVLCFVLARTRVP